MHKKENNWGWLKEVTSSDEQILKAFFIKNNVPPTVRGFSAFPLNGESANFICSKSHQDKFYIFVDEKTIKGFSMLRGWDEGYSIPSFGIIVDIDYQGKGIGSKILELTIEKCLQLGCKRMRLSVYSSHLISRINKSDEIAHIQ